MGKSSSSGFINEAIGLFSRPLSMGRAGDDVSDGESDISCQDINKAS